MELNAAAAMTRGLINEHLAGKGVYFEWDNAVKRFGCCHFRGGRPVKITLSRRLTVQNDEPTVRDTVLHEIAHAIAGSHAGHGPVWKAHARRIGADPTRCYDSAVVKAEHHEQSPYYWECPNGHTSPVYRRPTGRKQKSCGRCSRRFDPRYLLTFKVRGRVGVGR